MIRILSILLLSVPLLACAAENSSAKSAVVLEHITAITSGKSNRKDRQYWRVLLKWSDECETDFQGPPELQDPEDTDTGIYLYPAQNKEYIARVTCTLGSYQGRQSFFYLSLAGDNVITRTLLFPTYEVHNSKAVMKASSAELWGSVLNNSDYKKITILNQYSGYGNCGTLTTYRIDHDKVTAVKLRAAPDCESKTSSRDPNKWPEFPIP